MMEKQCFLRKSASTIVDNNAIESTYLLPDQSKVILRNERWQPPELIFDPKLMDVSLDGVHTNLVKCISNCDLELRRALFATVNIFGGVSKIPGFKERFINELQPICPHDAKIKLFSLKEPNNAMFSGGSVVAQLASLKGLFITKKVFVVTLRISSKVLADQTHLEFCNKNIYKYSYSSFQFPLII